MTDFIPLFDKPTPAADLHNTFNVLINEINGQFRTDVGLAGSVYSSRLVASLTEIPAAVLALQTAGYATRGDGGGATYYRTTGSTSGGFQSFDGAWWAIEPTAIDVRQFGAIANGASSTGVNAAVDAMVALGRTQIFLPINCWYLPTAGVTPDNTEIIGEDWQLSVITRPSPTTQYVSMGAHSKIIDCSIISKFAIDNASPAGNFKHAPVHLAINEGDASAICQAWPFTSLYFATGFATNLGGSSSFDVPAIGITNTGIGDSYFSATTNTSGNGGANLRIQPIGSNDYGCLVQPGVTNPGNVHFGVMVDEKGTNTSSRSIQVLRTLSGPVSLFLGDSGAGAAITSPFIALSSSRQSSGNFYQAFQTTQAYSGDFFNVNAGNGGGTFTGNFCNYTIANVPKFAVSFTGLVTTVASVNLQSGTAIPAGGTAGAGLLMSSVANFGVFFGSGAPGLSAAKGSLYLRSDGTGTNDRMYVNTNGSTTWTAVVTVA